MEYNSILKKRQLWSSLCIVILRPPTAKYSATFSLKKRQTIIKVNKNEKKKNEENDKKENAIFFSDSKNDFLNQ